MVSIAYIIPTLGRSTLARAVDGIVAQMLEADQLFVVGDGPRDDARRTMAERQRPGVYYLEHGPTNNWGCEQIDHATELVKADFIAYLGDDDEVTSGALGFIRAAVDAEVAQPHVFAMVHSGGVKKGTVVHGLVSGQQIVVPNDKTRLPRYSAPKPAESEASDYYFIQNVLKAWQAEGFRYHDDVIAVLHCQNHGRML